MDPYIGKMLDNRYEILELIGRGGMANVYKAKCHRLNRMVAVKILKNDLAENADFRRRFMDESRAVAQLNILCELALPLVKVGGQFLAMKSVDTDDEIQRARSAIAQLGGKIGKIWDYTIPGTDVRHRVVIIRKERPTPAAYPRPFARIKKAPLG